MMKTIYTFLTTALLATGVIAAELPVDTSHAGIDFKITHMVVSKVKGDFTDFTASLMVEDGKLTGAKAVIQAKSIDTNNERRDNHLRSADFFDVETYPTITFTSTKVENGKLIGTLDMHGVSKEVALDYEFVGPVTDPWGNARYGLSAEASLDRKDWGLTWNKAVETGGVLVGDTVDISISVEAIAK